MSGLGEFSGGATTIVTERCGSTLIITFGNPRRMNALSPPDVQHLAQTLREFDADDSLAVAVLVGQDERAFCSGADLKWAGENPEAAQEYVARSTGLRGSVFRRAHEALPGELPAEIWKPIIAAVRGYCLGGGLEMALQCDLIVAAQDALFGFPEVIRGWTPAGGGMLLAPRHLPLKIAMEMLLVGDPIDTARAYQVGLVNSVVPDGEDVLEAACRLAERIATNNLEAMRCIKEIAMKGLDRPLDYPASAWELLNSMAHNRIFDPERMQRFQSSFGARKPSKDE